ncbi:MAG: hypothetical protein A2504_05915 [Bdellovibrionales bacterium RIFOXYD12_FULL_39_22]|nr:MAG: hypothetical protein A2385_08235 [Bdellovibrionales bacterium RIFOXYB1_FULL_39_21]OFZ45309.1 MAG: hypothetical protein A2485_06305 [Bdellovibrionales bacterium RIFOXYC12_FULL_39_17]OFZ45502.1 MAG: hypothetical protein A2404_02815 [Bdellovibrionales bacterium RIFOXYC1_FULL_39_130]OFZ73724.1 MAG: hypothetical protein A2451_14805 [Bdellovibrionales bacterium RIFOXYC2_FULL_39_8]OFZ77363.1 MAG: hypothetical protein A2560_08405 [Bdellovibrionales bacterium RIFOXYD1_FULL_39_84]OFZ91492.1 MAG:
MEENWIAITMPLHSIIGQKGLEAEGPKTSFDGVLAWTPLYLLSSKGKNFLDYLSSPFYA